MLEADSGRPMASASDHRSASWTPASRSGGSKGGYGRGSSGGRHGEEHNSHRIGWLRAVVLGANDGTISVAGAASMAAGEFVSVQSQADTEQADLARERRELASDPARHPAGSSHPGGPGFGRQLHPRVPGADPGHQPRS
jgi:hypothetical protein